MRVIKKILAIILIILISYSIFEQYRAEKYISKQRETYGILKNRERINYFLPYIIHFYTGAINNLRNRRIESRAFFLPYILSDLKTAKTDKDLDSYMVYCYFSKDELKKFEDEKLFPLLPLE